MISWVVKATHDCRLMFHVWSTKSYLQKSTHLRNFKELHQWIVQDKECQAFGSPTSGFLFGNSALVDGSACLASVRNYPRHFISGRLSKSILIEPHSNTTTNNTTFVSHQVDSLINLLAACAVVSSQLQSLDMSSQR